MPLIHSKRPAAFKKNIETEMEHGKPQKQAVAIAYREAGEHRAHGGEMCAHGGPVHCDMGCYAEGGRVDSGYEMAKKEHHQILGEMHEDQADRKNLAEGGDVEPEMDHDEISDEDESEIHSALGQELMHAMEKKDHKGVAQAIEAMVMNCMAKGGKDV